MGAYYRLKKWLEEAKFINRQKVILKRQLEKDLTKDKVELFDVIVELRAELDEAYEKMAKGEAGPPYDIDTWKA